MELKTVEVDGTVYAAVQDGKPVFVVDGKENAYDVPEMAQKITSLSGEAMGHRKAKETAEAALKKFEGIEDPAAALEALKKIQNLGDKELIDAGKVDEIKSAAAKAAEEQKAAAIKAKDEEYAPMIKELEEVKKALHKSEIGGSFARSKFISDKLAVPVEMAEAYFGRHFSLEDGGIIARDASGNEIYSKVKPGERASFEEALEILVSGSPFRDSIMKGTGGSGSGAPGGGSGKGGNKVLSRAEYDSIPPEQRGAKIREGYTVADN